MTVSPNNAGFVTVALQVLHTYTPLRTTGALFTSSPLPLKQPPPSDATTEAT